MPVESPAMPLNQRHSTQKTGRGRGGHAAASKGKGSGTRRDGASTSSGIPTTENWFGNLETPGIFQFEEAESGDNRSEKFGGRSADEEAEAFDDLNAQINQHNYSIPGFSNRKQTQKIKIGRKPKNSNNCWDEEEEERWWKLKALRESRGGSNSGSVKGERWEALRLFDWVLRVVGSGSAGRIVVREICEWSNLWTTEVGGTRDWTCGVGELARSDHLS
nr:hypothetical protein Iba_chr14aCG14330 [Ipomoea batatas]